MSVQALRNWCAQCTCHLHRQTGTRWIHLEAETKVQSVQYSVYNRLLSALIYGHCMLGIIAQEPMAPHGVGP